MKHRAEPLAILGQFLFGLFNPRRSPRKNSPAASPAEAAGSNMLTLKCAPQSSSPLPDVAIIGMLGTISFSRQITSAHGVSRSSAFTTTASTLGNRSKNRDRCKATVCSNYVELCRLNDQLPAGDRSRETQHPPPKYKDVSCPKCSPNHCQTATYPREIRPQSCRSIPIQTTTSAAESPIRTTSRRISSTSQFAG